MNYSAGTHNRFESLLKNEETPTLYIDEPFISDAGPLLSRYQLQPTFNSRVKCIELKSKGRSPAAFKLRHAESDDLDRWSTLYSLGFGRKEALSVDRKRWAQSFENSALSHWFFTEKGQEIGVMQTAWRKVSLAFTASPSNLTERYAVAEQVLDQHLSADPFSSEAILAWTELKLVQGQTDTVIEGLGPWTIDFPTDPYYLLAPAEVVMQEAYVTPTAVTDLLDGVAACAGDSADAFGEDRICRCDAGLLVLWNAFLY